MVEGGVTSIAADVLFEYYQPENLWPVKFRCGIRSFIVTSFRYLAGSTGLIHH